MLDNRINALTTYYFQFDTSPLIRPYPTPRIKLDFGGSTLSPSSSCRFANRLQTPNATQIICYLKILLLGGWIPAGYIRFLCISKNIVYIYIYINISNKKYIKQICNINQSMFRHCRKPLDQTGTFEFEVTNVMNPVIYAFIYFFRELVESIT